MVLRVTTGGHGEALLHALAARLTTPLADPFAREQVVVHSRGIERWISQGLAQTLGVAEGGDGISANLHFPTPAELVGDVLVAGGVERRATAAWEPRALVWRLLDVAEDDGAGAGLEDFRARVDAAGDRRIVALGRVAEHLHRYALTRPDMTLAWLDGDDVDASGTRPLAEADRWQAVLYRHLRAVIDLPSPAEAVVTTVSGLADGGPVPAGLQRVALFGFTAVPAAHLAILTALGRRIDVDLLLRHPSPAAWARRTGVTGTLRGDGLPLMPPRPTDPGEDGSRLLTAWGRDVAELQVLVQTVAGDAVERMAEVEGHEREIAAAAAATVLGRLQQAVVEDADPPSAGTVGPDASVQFHACPGPARQVQVLRDEILRLLADDETLQPRDIIVLCPDVETFAPLVAAHLAGGDGGERPDLRVRIADRSLRRTNPILQVLDRLLELAATRVTLTAFTDLLASEPVRRRFGLSDDDLEEAGEWLADGAARWGMDERDRERSGLPSLRANTMAEALDRLLLGIALADEEDRSVGGITPHDDIEGSSVSVVGRVAEFAARLTQVLAELREPREVREWAAVLGRSADRLTSAPREEPWQRAELTQILQEVARTGAGSRTAVSLTEVRDLLSERLQGAPSRANHMTGDLTVCTLVPMRSVPHRVVCLLGMDDGAFPRQPRPHLDDLVSRQPRIGDVNPRSEDRQLLLDALLSASDHVVVTYTGTDPRSGESVPPCVPIAELRRTIDALGVPSHDDPRPTLSEALTTTHALYAFDAQAFRADRPSFDALAHRAAAAQPSQAGPGHSRAGLDHTRGDAVSAVAETDGPVTLAQLRYFLDKPAAAFVRQTLGLYVPDNPETPDEGIPLKADGLEQWRVGQALLDAGVGEEDHDVRDRVIAAMAGRGILPPEPLDDGTQYPAMTAGGIVELLRRMDVADHRDGDRLEVDVDLDGHQLQGTVAGVLDDRIVHVTYSKVADKRLMHLWVALLAATAAHPERPFEGIVVGRVGKKPGCISFAPLGGDPATRRRRAETLLTDLLALHRDGMREPLYAPAKTAHAYAQRRVIQQDPPDLADQDARKRWETGKFPGEAEIPAHTLLLGEELPYDILARRPARPQDTRLGHDPEPHHLAGLAMRLWAPLLEWQQGGRP